MEMWELAIVIIAITVMVVNFANVYMNIKFMRSFQGVMTKSVGLVEKMIDDAAKVYDDKEETKE